MKTYALTRDISDIETCMGDFEKGTKGNLFVEDDGWLLFRPFGYGDGWGFYVNEDDIEDVGSEMIAKAQQAKADKYLDQQVRYNGNVTTWREVIRKRILEDDWKAVIGRVPDHAKRSRAERTVQTMRRGWVPTGNENHPQTIKYRQALHDMEHATKETYRLENQQGDTLLAITKTGYEWAIQVIAEFNTAQIESRV